MCSDMMTKTNLWFRVSFAGLGQLISYENNFMTPPIVNNGKRNPAKKKSFITGKVFNIL